MTQKTSFEASVLVVNFVSQKWFQEMPGFFLLTASLVFSHELFLLQPWL